MTTMILVIHILVSVFLIFIVLLQGGKGAELGAGFGGSSQTLFGGRGAATFLNKMTTAIAVVFMLTSLLLAVVSVKDASIIKKPIAVKEMPASNAPVKQSTEQPLKPDTPVPAK